MSAAAPRRLSVFAPAKINLSLAVTGRRNDGYHLLDSLVCFADIGDQITLEAAHDFSFVVTGPFAKSFQPAERDHSPDSSNIVVQAAWSLSRLLHRPLDIRIRLSKHIPLSAGLGGGSADAAAVLWGLLQWWKMSRPPEGFEDLMLSLGADVPVCFFARTARMRGIGEDITPLPAMPEIPVVLVNPMKACPTKQVFQRYESAFRPGPNPPENGWDTLSGCMDFLRGCENGLTTAAAGVVPDIRLVLNQIETQEGCGTARLSGSGASCFGLFETENQAKKAAAAITGKNPDWWVKSGWLNRAERY